MNMFIFFFLGVMFIAVQHILGSLFHKYTVVWDLRKNEPIIKLSDNNSKVLNQIIFKKKLSN